MIQTESDLQVVRSQIVRLENTLSKLRAEVEPRNPRRFRLVAESYIDSLSELRAQVDAFVGAEAAQESSAPLIMTLSGEGVRLGEVRGSVVMRAYDSLRKGIAGVLDALTGRGDAQTSGRHLKWIEDVADLPFRLAPGSVRIVLGEPTTMEVFEAEQLRDFDRALGLIVRGIEWADQGIEEPLELGQNGDSVRQAVLLTLSRLLPAQGSEVKAISFGGRLVTREGGATLTRDSRGMIQRELRRQTTTEEFAELCGTIREVDLDKRQFRLRQSDDENIETECAFDERMQSEVTGFLDIGEPVLVAGILRTTKGRDRHLDVALIAPLEGSGSDGVEAG